jgi:hypothetical protein
MSSSLSRVSIGESVPDLTSRSAILTRWMSLDSSRRAVSTSAARVVGARFRRTKLSPAMTTSSTLSTDASSGNTKSGCVAGRPPTRATRVADDRCPMTPRVRGRFPRSETCNRSSASIRRGSGIPRSAAAVAWLKNCPDRSRGRYCRQRSATEIAVVVDRIPVKGASRSEARSRLGLTPSSRARLVPNAGVGTLRGSGLSRAIPS